MRVSVPTGRDLIPALRDPEDRNQQLAALDSDE